MAGHSHWARIKHKKKVTDARRGKLWSKLSRDLIVAARVGGGDPSMNPRLRLAIEKARSANMPKDTIEKAIKKGTGELEGESYEEILYEGYGPSGVAVMCQVLTDNRNRTSAEIKKLFERCGGNLGATNCVAWMFKPKGIITVNQDDADEERLMELAVETGADDVRRQGNVFEILCEPAVFAQLRAALEASEIPIESADLSMIPTSTVTLDAETGRRVLRLMEELDEHDDVQNVYSNFDIPEDIVAELTESA